MQEPVVYSYPIAEVHQGKYTISSMILKKADFDDNDCDNRINWEQCSQLSQANSYDVFFLHYFE